MVNISFFNLISTSNFDSRGKQSSVSINIPFSERFVTVPGINVFEKGNLKARFTAVRSKFLLYMIVTPEVGIYTSLLVKLYNADL